jgi:hypothetical protein
MTLGISYEDRRDLISPQQMAADSRLAQALSGKFQVGPAFDLNRAIDPSEGVNYQGGSSYSPSLPLLPSNAGLAGAVYGPIKDVRAGALSYGEAMDWTPAALTKNVQLSGLGAAETGSNVWYWIAAAGLAYWFYARTQSSRPTFFGR